MSDDESTYERTRVMNRYLFGSPSSSEAAINQEINISHNEQHNYQQTSSPRMERSTTYTNSDGWGGGGRGGGFGTSASTTAAATDTAEEQRYRSKSHESSRGQRQGIMRIKNKEIERGVSFSIL